MIARDPMITSRYLVSKVKSWTLFKSLLETFDEIDIGGYNNGNRDASNDIANECWFPNFCVSKRVKRSLPETIRFMSSTSGSKMDVHSPDDETSVIQRQKSKTNATQLEALYKHPVCGSSQCGIYEPLLQA